MMRKYYYTSAVIKGQYCEDKILAYSAKQAWYFFCKKYGFAIRDFKIIGMEEVKKNA